MDTVVGFRVGINRRKEKQALIKNTLTGYHELTYFA